MPSTVGDRPEDPEELAEWRVERGIPVEATGYALPEIDDHEWTEADKVALAAYGEAFLDVDLPQDKVDKIVAKYAAQLGALREADATHNTETRNALKEAWGDSYSAKIKGIKRYLADEADIARRSGRDARRGAGCPTAAS